MFLRRLFIFVLITAALGCWGRQVLKSSNTCNPFFSETATVTGSYSTGDLYYTAPWPVPLSNLAFSLVSYFHFDQNNLLKKVQLYGYPDPHTRQMRKGNFEALKFSNTIDKFMPTNSFMCKLQI
jgi:hypothetical protein